jgi:hypothetical protein
LPPNHVESFSVVITESRITKAAVQIEALGRSAVFTSKGLVADISIWWWMYGFRCYSRSINVSLPPKRPCPIRRLRCCYPLGHSSIVMPTPLFIAQKAFP